jgi:nicotinate-nucleotide pyrophosphorylase (carboxylating)
MRFLEKQAVVIGGGTNHRFGLYDMMMIKDNHNDHAGGITAAIERAKAYQQEKGISIPIEVEARDAEEVREILAAGPVDRIMLDNFTPDEIRAILPEIGNQAETEASGGITEATIRSYAETGVDYISVGALTHSVKSLDLSLKAIRG